MKNTSDIPVLFENKEDCCGCTACYSICPVRAIVMIPDKEGFEYPGIEERVCIRCGRCVSVCPCHRDISTEN